MLYALPTVIHDYLETLEQMDNNLEALQKIAFSTLKALELTVSDSSLIKGLQKELLVVSVASERDVSPFELFSEASLPMELAGFARLFASAVDAGELALESPFDFASLEDEELKEKLHILEETSLFLEALSDLSNAFSLPNNRSIATCIFLEGLEKIVPSSLLADWLSQRPLSSLSSALWYSRRGLEEFSPPESTELITPFASWVLCHLMLKGCRIMGAPRKRLETLLEKAGLPHLKVFERAGFFDGKQE